MIMIKDWIYEKEPFNVDDFLPMFLFSKCPMLMINEIGLCPCTRGMFTSNENVKENEYEYEKGQNLCFVILKNVKVFDMITIKIICKRK